MPRYSYHVSHEQHSPADLLRHVQHAEAAGFDAAFSSDHLQPWGPAQGHSGATWPWLGAALQATQRIPISLITVPGGWRYHPVMLAQSIATLARMYPGRLPWVALGSGEAVNECVVGQGWPDKAVRNQRLAEAAQSMRALLRGERVQHDGLVPVHDARLWPREPCAVQLIGAATSPETARWLASWADGLLTVASSVDELRDIVQAFRDGGGEGKPVHIKVDLSWAPTDEAALQSAYEQWRYNAAPGNASADARQPEDFDRLTRDMRPEDIRQHVFVSHEFDAHIEHLRQCATVGAETIDLHNVGLNQAEFIDAFASRVLPALRGG